jgi:hypothetical protein
LSVDMLLSLAGTVASIIGGFWVLLALAGRQFEKRLDDRFAAQEEARKEGRKAYEERLARVEQEQRDSDRLLLKFLADLPREYMRREDHIRFETLITAKLDALNAEMRLLAERLPKRDD